MTPLSAGDPAPDFELATDDGGRFRLSAQRGRLVILFFYPEDGTEGCTIENLEFSRLASEFASLGATVLGISPDSVESHCDFRDRHGLMVPLASDPGHEAIGAFGVWGPKKLYGREYEGLHRTTFLVGPEGRIAAIWPVRRIKGHAQVVLDAARRMTAGR